MTKFVKINLNSRPLSYSKKKKYAQTVNIENLLNYTTNNYKSIIIRLSYVKILEELFPSSFHNIQVEPTSED